MENEKYGLKLFMAGLKFSKSEMAEECSKEKNTNPAVLMIALSVILGTVIAFFKGNGGSSGFGRMGLTGMDAAIAEFGSLVIGSFLSALIMVYVIRIFKVKPSYAEIIRVYGAATTWTVIKIILLGLILPASFGMLGIAFWLAYNFSVMFGLTGLTKIKLWQSFISIVLTFAVVFGIMMLYGVIVGSIFG
ncbi:MAG: YIP1 family protein [Chloroflexota bacterium]